MAKLPNLLDQMATSLNISSSTSEEFNTPGDSINVDELSGTFVEKISLLLNENSNEFNAANKLPTCSNIVEESLGLLPLSKIENGEDDSFSMNVSQIIKHLEDNIPNEDLNTGSINSIANCSHNIERFNDTLEEVAYILERSSVDDKNKIIDKYVSRIKHVNQEEKLNNTCSNRNIPSYKPYTNQFIQSDYGFCDTSDESIRLQVLSKIEEEDSYETSHIGSSLEDGASSSSTFNTFKSADDEEESNQFTEVFKKPEKNESSKVFNDTLEEIEYMLNCNVETLNESTSNSDDVSLTTEALLLEETISSMKPIVNRQSKPKKYGNILSPVACYIKQTPTKIINKNINIKSVTPISSLKISKDNYKNVLSPVSVYIKNSPYSPLKQMAQMTKMNKENILTPNTVTNVNNKTDESIKMKIYRPSTIKHIIKEDDPKLPKEICKLLTPPLEVIKHNNHIRCNTIDADETLTGDLTEMALNNGDISVLTSKKFY